MNCKEIIIEYLKTHGFDGLCNPYGECGCGIDDLIPCECDISECSPAYKRECSGKCCNYLDCDIRLEHEQTSGGYCFHPDRIDNVFSMKNGMSVSEYCHKYKVQDCGNCEDFKCCDNMATRGP
jgi:hypothetical protein